jgi:hypothetical protein
MSLNDCNDAMILHFASIVSPENKATQASGSSHSKLQHMQEQLICSNEISCKLIWFSSDYHDLTHDLHTLLAHHDKD